MKSYSWVFALVLLISISCGKSKKHDNHDEGTSDNPNEALYDQVMDIHNEVMPRMEEIYQLKKQLKVKTASPEIDETKKKELNQIIFELDSADRSMMDWMHKFNPLPDSADREKAREYLENEMEKIKMVKELMNSSIERAKEETRKK